MGILDDTAIFAAVMAQGGFSHAARHLGLSNGLISRRINELEQTLGVTLIKRTTRQLHLTAEGELFWQHAQRIQKELDKAVNLIQATAVKPRGTIRISAPFYFGRNYLTPIVVEFIKDFPEIHVDLILSNKRMDIIKDEIDLSIRGAGYLDEPTLKDSSLRMKTLVKDKIGLYASPNYLSEQGEPKVVSELSNHKIIYFAENKTRHKQKKWSYFYRNKKDFVLIKPKFVSNDLESNVNACVNGYGIARFTELHIKKLHRECLTPILTNINWGQYHLYAIYPQQQNLPKRTRLLLEYLQNHLLRTV